MNKSTIAGAISEVIKQLYNTETTVEISYPEPAFGDLSTNVAFTLAQQLGKPPREIATEISTALQHPSIRKAEIAGAAYINLWLSKEVFATLLKDISAQESFGLHQSSAGSQRITVEYGHPNTHKLPHIGHLFSYIAGDSLARILSAQGQQVRKVNYQGDIGPHVARCISGWREKGRPEPQSLLEKVQLLQECYQLGSTLFEESPEHAERITAINQALYSKSDQTVVDDWEKTRAWSLSYYEAFEQQLGIEQSQHYLESAVWETGVEIVRRLTGSVFTESDGAVIFPGENHGLHNRVFITQQQTPTYETKELGLNLQKYRDEPFDLTIIPTAREQEDYFKVVTLAIEQSVPELQGKVSHISFGHVQLTTGKMSSRKGNILAAVDLLERVRQEVSMLLKDRDSDLVNDQDHIEAIAQGAIKYAFLRSTLGKDIYFDPKQAVDIKGDSGPYLQYAHSRAHSILNKAESTRLDGSQMLEDEDLDEKRLITLLGRFPEYVAQAGNQRAPHLLAMYLYQLGQEFNGFYERQVVLGSPKEHLRLQIVRGVAQVLSNGLSLLGIKALERM